jgi:arabinogalactan endo-1,4-beta-galactosidase
MPNRIAGLLAALTLFLPSLVRADPFWFGADLSFANEMEDCGATFRDGNTAKDVFEIFHAHGANLVRVRLWNDPDWTHYSNLADVEKTIRRAHAAGMQVLLDFHYSDDWADGDKQIRPKAWAGLDDAALAKALYAFTFDTLTRLNHDGLTPELVQVGNETNPPLLGGKKGEVIDWTRNAALFNAAIKAVRDAGAGAKVQPRVMIHIAQPENVEPWFKAATAAGVTDFDLIGISYYPKWSKETMRGLGLTINRLRYRYPAAQVMVVETAYPWTLDNADTSPNVLGQDSLIPDYPATPTGQKKYLVDLTQTVMSSGGVGVVYWAPDWVSTRCKTRWGQGSSWDNATYFDFDHRLLPGIDFMAAPYVAQVPVSFVIHARSAHTGPFYLWGDFLGAKDFVVRVDPDGKGGWRYGTTLAPGLVVRFQLYGGLPLGAPLLTGDAAPGGAASATVGTTETVVERTVP